MPCNCDYLEPNSYEIESKIVCENFKYLLECLDKPVPIEIANGARRGAVPIINEVTAGLCLECSKLTPEQQDRFIYNGRSKKARALADWWDKHQEADRKREAKERADKKRLALVKQALGKLSKQEIEALRNTKF